MSLRTRIVATYIGLTVVAVLGASAFSSWEVKHHLNRVWTSNLKSHVDMLSRFFEEGALSLTKDAANDERLVRVARSLNIRLTLITKDGKVLFDSEVPRDSLGNLENHRGRPEIQKASRTGVGMDQRFSASTGRMYYYAAQAVQGRALGELDSGYVRGALSEDEAYRLDADVQTIIWVIGILTIAAIALVSIQVARRITDPVLSIATTAKRITGGDLSHRAFVRSHDEIGDLARSVNDMAGKLQADIERLRKLERVRSEFLANVSHELRTPIFSIQGFLETLLDGAVDDPNVNRDFLEKAHRHAMRLNTLLNDLIEIARIESGEMKMSLRYFSVVEFLQQMYDELKPVAEKRQLGMELHVPLPAETKVYGDRDRLRQVMLNLVDNAAKYTDQGGTIRISGRTAENRCTITVEDTGIGIAEEHLPRLFERFYRVDKDRSRDAGGTGLGLAIVKHIVEAHGGTITVESTVGKGSVFGFSLQR